MNEQNETYFGWLTSLIGITDATDDLLHVCTYLYDIKYKWRFVLDKNRALAGENLRHEYISLSGTSSEEMPDSDCSVFEMLVALSARFSENANISIRQAYTEICCNLKILPEQLGEITFEKVKNRINKWLDGDQDCRACPGPFPLLRYSGDARNMDLWSLMNAYISENYPLAKDWLK